MNTSLSAIRVYITEKCNANCVNCFNNSTRTNKEMTCAVFEKLCIWLSENKIKHLKIMGGEPTIHSNFVDIISLAQRYFDRIGIFTNGIDDQIYRIKLRNNDSITYNFTFNHFLSKEKLHLLNGGRRSLEVQILANSDEHEIIQRIKDLFSENEKVPHVSLTLDCKANIFQEKKIVLPKLLFVERELLDSGIPFSYDHKIPFCYLFKTGLRYGNSSLCTISSSGVIDANLNLRYCLQNTSPLIPICHDGVFIPWPLVINQLTKQYFQLRLQSLDKICSNCIFFGTKCNGGCWIPNKNISKEDILSNTSFPTC